jgi:transposase, IS5 family
MQKPFEVQRALFVDGVEALLDWRRLEALMAAIYASGTGRPSYPLLSLFRALLLGVWYGLSDVGLSKSLARDLLFRKFCRLELDAGTPDDTTLGRFRDKLRKHDL